MGVGYYFVSLYYPTAITIISFAFRKEIELTETVRGIIYNPFFAEKETSLLQTRRFGCLHSARLRSVKDHFIACSWNYENLGFTRSSASQVKKTELQSVTVNLHHIVFPRETLLRLV